MYLITLGSRLLQKADGATLKSHRYIPVAAVSVARGSATTSVISCTSVVVYLRDAVMVAVVGAVTVAAPESARAILHALLAQAPSAVLASCKSPLSASMRMKPAARVFRLNSLMDRLVQRTPAPVLRP